MNTEQTIEAIRAKNGGCTDYRIAVLMGIDRNRISHYMRGNRTMTAEHRIIAAKLLNHDPAQHLIYMEMERTKDPKAYKIWEHALKRITATAAAIAVAVFVAIAPRPAEAAHLVIADIRRSPPTIAQDDRVT